MSRRTLAVSVVVTISLAEIGCTPSSSGEAPVTAPVTVNDPKKPEIEVIAPNPPDPAPSTAVEDEGDDFGSAPAQVASKVRIERRSDGTCLEIVDVACPEGVQCNPPPPTVVPCPPDHPDLPEAKQGENVTRRDDGSCWAFTEFRCPEGATCNPPPPRQVACPPAKQYPQAKDPERVTKRANGQCWESRKVSCPPGARCNPPPPRRVECPEDLEDVE
jgi:hypothetical protein